MERTHRIRILGPIDVVTRTGTIGVGGRQARALLAALVVSTGRAVSVEYLQEVLWGARPPPSADNTLQSYVSHLRQILGTDLLIRVEHSYKLDADSENIDTLLFEDLVTRATDLRADPEQCSQLSREALKLWRGRPFGDLANEKPFLQETHRLDELRLAAIELKLEADLALGHHELIIGELEKAVEDNPYRERPWYLLIEALARSDRRVEALRTCTRLRSILADVGLHGSNELISLEQQILNADSFPTSA